MEIQLNVFARDHTHLSKAIFDNINLLVSKNTNTKYIFQQQNGEYFFLKVY